MSGTPAIVLHLGAPQCGARALQRALSTTPELTTGDSTRLSYAALRPGSQAVLSGKALRRAAAREVSGQLDWSGPEGPPLAPLDRLRRRRGGTVPLVSNPDWIGQTESFAEALPDWFREETGAPTGLCALVRPPLDWLNAAYWDWGIWSGRGFGSWLAQMGMPYTLGAALARWAALPDTRLALALAEDDPLPAAEALLGTDLPRPAQGSPGALPPAFLGFLMRNRRYRADAGDRTAEDVFRRWCHVAGAPRPWAVLPRHLGPLRAATRADLDLLLPLLPEAVRADPRWQLSEDAYHAELIRGRSPLDDPEELAALYRALVRGVGAAAETAGKPVPPLQPVLATRASAHSWDVALARALEHLIALDAGLRRRRLSLGR
ncbi:hypothetical protein WAF00_28865 [Mameliella alba]|uniref:hypothetical protein n=1 Tax=Mameliella alba TaxID=561184 RepID=UPI003012EDB6